MAAVDSSSPSLPQVVLRLTALKENVEAYLKANTASFFKASRIRHYFNRYNALSALLRSALPALFSDLPDREPRYDSSDDTIWKDSLEDLVLEMDYAMTILSRTSIDQHGIALRVTREGAFFAGQQFDAIRQVQEIISGATQNIVLIDGYSDEKTLDLLTVKPAVATARLLTKPRSVTPAFRGAANAFNQQYHGLEVRTSDAYHDRFLYIDDRDFFHFGASLNHAGKRAFMFSRIEEPSVTVTSPPS